MAVEVAILPVAFGRAVTAQARRAIGENFCVEIRRPVAKDQGAHPARIGATGQGHGGQSQKWQKKSHRGSLYLYVRQEMEEPITYQLR